MTQTTQRLGKGLSMLLSEMGEITEAAPSSTKAEAGSVVYLSPDLLQPGSWQPRTFFNPAAISELASSIKQNGMLQPILVRPIKGSEKYEIIAGERRWRASQELALAKIPAIIKRIDNDRALEISLIENIQRENLSPIEEAAAYQRLINELSYTHDKLAKQVGKSRSHISNLLRILQLPESVKKLIELEQITMGHARALVGAQSPEKLAEEVIRKGLSVRQTEKLAKGHGTRILAPEKKSNPLSSNPINTHKDEDLIALEFAMIESLGMKVSVAEDARGGTVTIHFSNLSDLDAIIQRLTD